jgi:hypothetical protein
MHKYKQRKENTLTILLAAASGVRTRAKLKAASELNASHTPSLHIMSLPPVLDSCSWEKKKVATHENTHKVQDCTKYKKCILVQENYLTVHENWIERHSMPNSCY